MKTPNAAQRSFAGLSLLTLLVGCDASKTLSLLPGSDETGTGHAGSAGSGPVVTQTPDSGTPGPVGGAGGTGGTPGVEGGAGGAQTVTGTGGLSVGGLLHRYTFSGTGTTLVDSVGNADGAIHGGAELTGSGELTLDGVDDYVSLPSGLISSLTSVTIVVWFAWHSTRPWERVFDFGSYWLDDQGRRNSATHFFFTPLRSDTGQAPPGPSANIWNGMAYMPAANGNDPFPANEEQMIAIVFDGTTDTLRAMDAFIGTDLVGSVTDVPFSLSEIRDENCWLGQSQSYQDPNTSGTYNEFRIYGAVLTNAEVRWLFSGGPDRL